MKYKDQKQIITILDILVFCVVLYYCSIVDSRLLNDDTKWIFAIIYTKIINHTSTGLFSPSLINECML